MKTTIINLMMTLALAFCLGGVSSSYAGVIDITDPENPIERSLEIDISGMSYSAIQNQMISLSVDATGGGLPVGDAAAQFKAIDEETFTRLRMSLRSITKATMTISEGVGTVNLTFGEGTSSLRSSSGAFQNREDSGSLDVSYDIETGVILWVSGSAEYVPSVFIRTTDLPGFDEKSGVIEF